MRTAWGARGARVRAQRRRRRARRAIVVIVAGVPVGASALGAAVPVGSAAGSVQPVVAGASLVASVPGVPGAAAPGRGSTAFGRAGLPPVVLASRPAVPGERVRVADRSAVVERPADQTWGSGLQYPYGANAHASSPPALLAAAAADPRGCLIAGDSVAMADFAYLAARFTADLGARCVHDGWPGRRTEGTANALADMWLHEGLPPRVIVLAGANDVFNPPEFEAEARRLLTVTASVQRVLWVTPFVSRRPETINTAADERNSAYLRDVLARIAPEYQNLVLVRWQEFFDSRRDRMDVYLPDGIHPNLAGQDLMATMIEAAWG